MICEDGFTVFAYILHMVEAERRAAASVFQGFRGEGFIVTVDETKFRERKRDDLK